MSVVLVTGSAGLIGAEAVRFLAAESFGDEVSRLEPPPT
jgi:NAD(P)-dependent dehydrogenase (short-subunit alcohol dehydrogenase family)